ncbi:MAG: hypothetical protein ACREVW_18025 [Burkholderiales bacterium]
MRLSIRDFAAHLGVGARTVNKWEARGATITLLPDTQALMDTALSRAPEEVKTRFTQTVSNGEQEQSGNKAQRVEPADSLLSAEPGTRTPHSQWNHHSITFTAGQITGEDLSFTRRDALATGASVVLAGVALTEPLQQWLLPIDQDAGLATCRSEFSPTELASLERLVEQFRGWSSNGNGTLARKAVVAQLNDVTDRLREVSPSPATRRAFRIAAELSEVAASMSWDAGLHRCAQRYYVLSVQLAKLAGDDGLAAIVLASLARQCYDLGRPRDGVEIVHLAQYGSRKAATPLLRAMLATREAWGYAQLGESQAFIRAVGLAEDYFSAGPSDGDPRALRYFDAAELAGTIGGRYRDLALARHEPQWARRAQDYTRQALDLRRPSQLRLRTFDLIGLARTQLVAADPQCACELVRQSIPLARPWVNGRVGAKLREFHQEASRYADIPVVRDTRDLIQELTSANKWMKGPANG